MVLCCDKIDRLTRSFSKELVTLDDLRRTGKIELHFPSDNIILHNESPATDLFRFTMGVSLAKYFSDSISDNVKRAYEAKIKKGEWIGKAPVGYMNVADENGRKNIVPDPERSPYIKKIFQMYASGKYSMRQIVERINELGYKSNTKYEKPLTLSKIVHILENSFYYGFMRIKGFRYPHKYQPLITTELYFTTKRIKKQRYNLPKKIESKPYIFRGIIRCGECGCAISPGKHKGHVYYSCTNYKKYHKKKTYVREEELLKPVYEMFEGIKFTDEQIKDIVADLKTTTKAENRFFTHSMRELQKEYARFENRISKLADDRYDGNISKDFYDKKFKEYSIKQENILTRMGKYDKADKDSYITAQMILEIAKNSRDLFDKSEIHEKNHLLKFVLQNCELSGKNLQYKMKTPFDTMLEMRGCSEMLPLKVAFRKIDWKEIRNRLELFELI
jgi:site-specific DNA recombinase